MVGAGLLSEAEAVLWPSHYITVPSAVDLDVTCEPRDAARIVARRARYLRLAAWLTFAVTASACLLWGVSIAAVPEVPPHRWQASAPHLDLIGESAPSVASNDIVALRAQLQVKRLEERAIEAKLDRLERLEEKAQAAKLQGDSWQGAGMCGIGTNMLDHNDAAMTTFCDARLDFWWNWAPVPRNRYTAPCAESTFVPMVWGFGEDNKYIAKKAGETYGKLMGYNEPDLWGPPPFPGADYLSSGTFAPTFHCGSAALAKNWQDTVSFFKASNPEGIVLSPAMADPSKYASSGDYSQCDTSPQMPDSHIRFCVGWLKCFKESVIKLSCGSTNCWDIIDVLQFHAYEYKSEHLIGKVQNWERTWVDDLQGTGGRKKKTLWLTEFAHAGTTDASDPDGEARAFMEASVGYLRDSPYVSGWSWFSENNQSFASFVIDEITPVSKFWSSELIDKAGAITTLGQKYKDLCSQIPPIPR